MRRCANIIRLYAGNTGFRWMFCMIAVSALLSRVFFYQRWFLFSEEAFTMLFVMVLWLSFHMGILLKRQFANFRSSILPGYRKSHVLIFLFMYAALICSAVLWGFRLPLRLPWLSQFSMVGIWGVCLLSSLFVIVLGYLSMGRALLYGYCVLLALATFSIQVADTFEKSSLFVYLPLGLWVSGLIIFVVRLFKLKEESIEYGNLLTWPPKDFGKFMRYRSSSNFFNRFQKEKLTREKYSNRKGLFGCLAHWNGVEGNEPGLLSAMALVVAGFYVLIFLKVPWALSWVNTISQLFLMYVLTPLVMLAVFYYKRLAFWGHDLMRPVTRERYFKDQACVVFAHLFLYWLFTVLALAVVPNVLFSVGPVLSIRFFAFILLSGAFTFLTVAVLSVLSAIDSVPRIIINGGLLSCLVIIFFDIVPDMALKGYGVFIGVCLASGLVFIKHGYHAWCNKEYV